LKELRLGRIFGKDGRAVIIACDHAGFMGPVQGLEEPGKLLDALADSGIDAVLTTRGVARRFAAKFGKLGLILRADGGASIASPVMGSLHPLFSVEDALKLGADAMICMGMIGFPEEPSSLQNLAAFTAQSLSWGMPVIAEMLVKPKEGESVTAKDIGFAMRIGAELGADVIKASFARPGDAYRSALQSCYCPVVVLGGEKVKNETEMLQAIAEALEAGATGVAIGRNVWQHAKPGGVCRALVELVHGSGRVEKALKEIRG
jgi:DhnA family fructose-bisphosphate aldolase class Ia